MDIIALLSEEFDVNRAIAERIVALIDEVLAQHRFVRTFCNPIQNMNDATIYRMTARYRRRITDTETM